MNEGGLFIRRCHRRLFFVISIIASLVSISCSHKPAYSNIQTDKEKSQAQREALQKKAQQAEQSAGASPADPQAPSPESPEALLGGGSQASESKPAEIHPAFLNQRTGQFEDLPQYPRSVRTNVQIGPINGIESGLFVLETSDPIERIAEFYDNAIRKNGWRVVNNTRDKEYLKWELMKGKTSEAIVEVKSDAQSTRKAIILSRAERPEGK